jgi:hypothetical protein
MEDDGNSLNFPSLACLARAWTKLVDPPTRIASRARENCALHAMRLVDIMRLVSLPVELHLIASRFFANAHALWLNRCPDIRPHRCR